MNQKGLVTMDRKLKKDAFYLYKAYWSSEPFVHICGRRYVNRAEDVTEVKVYSNQPEVTLFVDGKEAGTEQGRYCFRFRVPISGEHRIRAAAMGESKEEELWDEISICRSEKPDPSYQVIQKGGVVNWFDKEDFDQNCYSIKDTYGSLLADSRTAAIVGKLMEGAAASRGDVAESVKDNPNLVRMMSRLTLESLLNQAGDAVKPEQIKAINAALQKIRKPEVDETCR